MNWQEAEQLAERISTEVPKLIVVKGIEPLGPQSTAAYTTAYGVKIACKLTDLSVIVKSWEHWQYLTQHAIVRFCKSLSQFMTR